MEILVAPAYFGQRPFHCVPGKRVHVLKDTKRMWPDQFGYFGPCPVIDASERLGQMPPDTVAAAVVLRMPNYLRNIWEEETSPIAGMI